MRDGVRYYTATTSGYQNTSCSITLTLTTTGTWIPDPALPSDPAPPAVYVLESSSASYDKTGTNVTGGSADDGCGDPMDANGLSQTPASPLKITRETGSFTITRTFSASSTGGSSSYGYSSIGCGLASYRISIIHPHPVNYRPTGVVDNIPGYLGFKYKWDSSTGSLSDLQGDVTERVTYDGNPGRYVYGVGDGVPGTYFPPNPPINHGYPNPTTSGVAASSGVFEDEHFKPATTTPYSSVSYTGVQIYRFHGDDMQEGVFETLRGPLDIVRSVYSVAPPLGLPNEMIWYYSISKEEYTSTIQL